MGLGALYDLAFGAAMLLFHRPAGRILGIEAPADPLYLRFGGLLLLIVGAVYLFPAASPARYQGIVVVAVLGRLAGFGFLLAAWLDGRPPAFLGLALADLAFAAVHALLLGRARRGARASLRPS